LTTEEEDVSVEEEESDSRFGLLELSLPQAVKRSAADVKATEETFFKFIKTSLLLP
jgi:hypothetical protein